MRIDDFGSRIANAWSELRPATRGLVELVVLNIGYDLGILSGRIFAMMVLMALVTTFMTGPLLSLVNIRAKGNA